MRLTKIIDKIKTILIALDGYNLVTYAASTSFFFFLSFIPMTILFCALIPYTPLDIEYVRSVVDTVVPQNLTPLIMSIILQIYSRSAGTVTVSVVITLWMAGRGMAELIKALNNIHGFGESRGYLRLRLYSSLYTLFILFSLMSSLLILVFGRRILKALSVIPEIEAVYEFATSIIGIQYVFTFMLLVILFSLLYSRIPAEKSRIKSQLPGAVICAASWLTFTYLFSIYLQLFNPFSAYGSLTTTIVIIVWTYACMYFVMLGAILNKYLGKGTDLKE